MMTGHVVHTLVPLLPSSIIWYWLIVSDAMQLGRSLWVWHHIGRALETSVVLDYVLSTGSRHKKREISTSAYASAIWSAITKAVKNSD